MVYSASLSSTMEIACTDEVKVYKDEGEEEEQKKSSENLTEDKVGLVIEGEGQCSPKNAFNLGFVSLGDYYHSLLPLPFSRDSPFSRSATSPYAVAAAAAAAAYGAACARAAAAAAVASQHASIFSTTATATAATATESLIKRKHVFSSSHVLEPVSRSSTELPTSALLLESSHLRCMLGDRINRSTNEARKFSFPISSLQTDSQLPDNSTTVNLSAMGSDSSNRRTSPLPVETVTSTSSTVAAVAAFHTELLKAANVYGLRTSNFTNGTFPNTASIASQNPSLYPTQLFGNSSRGTTIPFLGRWTETGLCSMGSHSQSRKLQHPASGNDEEMHAQPFAGISRSDYTTALQGCLSSSESAVEPAHRSLSSFHGSGIVSTSRAVGIQSLDHLSNSPCSNDTSQHAAIAAAAAAHVRLLSSLAVVAASQHNNTNPSSMRSAHGTAEYRDVSVSRTSSSSYSALDLLSESDRSSNGNELPHPRTISLPSTSGSMRPSNLPFLNAKSLQPPLTETRLSPSAINRLDSKPPTPTLDRPQSPPELLNNSISSSSAKSTTVGSHQTQQSGAKRVHIKKPLNAFMLFMKDMRPRVQEECTLKESAAINQILGRKWHELPREKQAKYYEMARKEKELHHQLFPGWSARDNYAMHSRRKKKRRLAAAAIMVVGSRHGLPTDAASAGVCGGLTSGAEDDGSLSGAGVSADGSSAKKCRARFGLEHQHRWCKPCRRKKKCIRFMTDAEFEESECNRSTPPHSSTLASPHKSPTPAVKRSRTNVQDTKPFSAHANCLSASRDLWSRYVPNLTSSNAKSTQYPLLSMEVISSDRQTFLAPSIVNNESKSTANPDLANSPCLPSPSGDSKPFVSHLLNTSSFTVSNYG